jgi:hypothetical protein
MKALASIFLLLLLLEPARAQAEIEEKYAVWTIRGERRWLTYHLEPEDVLRVKQKWSQIDTSLGTEKKEFAGRYFQYGFMSGSFLIWSPSIGFVYVQYFDIEHPCYFSYGQARKIGEEVEFKVEYETKRSICPGGQATPLKWISAGDGEFFIPITQAKRFGEFYAGRGEFNGFFLKWREDEPFLFARPRQAAGQQQRLTKFVLPPGYRKFIRRSIEGKIISIGRKRIEKYKPTIFSPSWDQSSLTPVKLNVGRLQGVTSGMYFVLLDENDADAQTLKITTVDRTSSKGLVVRQVDDKGVEGFFSYDEQARDYITKPFSPLVVGLSVTTSPIQKLP